MPVILHDSTFFSKSYWKPPRTKNRSHNLVNEKANEESTIKRWQIYGGSFVVSGKKTLQKAE